MPSFPLPVDAVRRRTGNSNMEFVRRRTRPSGLDHSPPRGRHPQRVEEQFARRPHAEDRPSSQGRGRRSILLGPDYFLHGHRRREGYGSPPPSYSSRNELSRSRDRGHHDDAHNVHYRDPRFQDDLYENNGYTRGFDPPLYTGLRPQDFQYPNIARHDARDPAREQGADYSPIYDAIRYPEVIHDQSADAPMPPYMSGALQPDHVADAKAMQEAEDRLLALALQENERDDVNAKNSVAMHFDEQAAIERAVDQSLESYANDVQKRVRSRSPSDILRSPIPSIRRAETRSPYVESIIDYETDYPATLRSGRRAYPVPPSISSASSISGNGTSLSTGTTWTGRRFYASSDATSPSASASSSSRPSTSGTDRRVRFVEPTSPSSPYSEPRSRHSVIPQPPTSSAELVVKDGHGYDSCGHATNNAHKHLQMVLRRRFPTADVFFYERTSRHAWGGAKFDAHLTVAGDGYVLKGYEVKGMHRDEYALRLLGEEVQGLGY